MRPIQNLEGETLKEAMTTMLDPAVHPVTDGLKSYTAAAGKASYSITAKNFDPVNEPNHLKWLHTIVSNAKAFVLGTYHGLDKKHLQAYLEEYCYRFSRRNFEGQGFNRLLQAALDASTITFAELTA